HGEPAIDTGPAVQPAEQVVLGGEDRVGRGVDDRPDQVVTVLEVVVELATTRRGAGTHLVKAHPRRPPLGDQLRARLDNPCARRASSRGGRLRRGHTASLGWSGLDSPLRDCFADKKWTKQSNRCDRKENPVSPTIQEQSNQIGAASRHRLPAEVLETFARDQAAWQAKGRPADAVAVGDVL